MDKYIHEIMDMLTHASPREIMLVYSLLKNCKK